MRVRGDTSQFVMGPSRQTTNLGVRSSNLFGRAITSTFSERILASASVPCRIEKTAWYLHGYAQIDPETVFRCDEKIIVGSGVNGLRSSAWSAPLDAAPTKPEMRSAVLLPPDGRMKGRGAVAVLGEPPARAFVRKKVHVQNPTATARAYHGRMFAVTAFLDHVENPPPEDLG